MSHLQASLTWEKRLSLGFSAPGNILCTPEEQQQQQQQKQEQLQQQTTKKKESHILEGLRKLQRRKQRSSSASLRVYKECMNSNEGIYSLGLKSNTKETTIATREWSNNKLGLYDSDDSEEQDVPTRVDLCSSLCSWDGISNSGSAPLAPPSQLKDNGPEELLSFINSLLPEGGHTSAFSRPSRLTSDTPDPESVPKKGEEKEPFPDVQIERARLQCLQGRTQSADSKPRPLSLVRAVGVARSSQSEESILAMLEVEAELQEMVLENQPTRQRVETLEGPQKIPAVTPTGPSAEPPRRRLTRPTARSAPSRIPASARLSAPPPRTSQGSNSDTTQESSQNAAAAITKTSRTSRMSRVTSWRTSAYGPASEGEQPTRDQHCESTAIKGKIRSPSPPPPPPGRSTSLLVRPPQQLRSPPQGLPSRAPPPSYQTSLLPSLQATLPIRDKQSNKSPAGGAAARGGTRRSFKSDCAAAPPTPSPLDTGHNPTRTPKNVPPPYNALRYSASAFTTKKGPAHQGLAPPTVQSCPTPNMSEKVGKSRIPTGFKAFLKAPPTCKSGTATPGKQEKDHLNSVSRESGTSNHASPQGSLTLITAGTTRRSRFGVGDTEGEGPAESCGAQRSSQVFCRPPYPKPVLGLTGAKARSQSFSSSPHHPPPPTAEGSQVRSRTHIITTSGERGGAGSLTRHSSLEVPASIFSTGPSHNLTHSPRTRLSHYGSMAVPPTGHCGISSMVQKAKACAHSPTSGHTPSDQNPTNAGVQSDSRCEISLSARSIEEKVMLGIEENVQKTQENQEKMALGEVRTRTRTKTTSSLANWFGLRRSKLPALGGKKATEVSRSKEDKEEKKMSPTDGGKIDRRKEKDKNQDALLEVNNKLSSIMDHCNNHMGHIANHIHTSTAFMGKEQLVRELLGRWVWVFSDYPGSLGFSGSLRA